MLEHALADSQLAVQDSVVRYACVEGFVATDPSAMSIVCDGDDWKPSPAGCERKASVVVS